MRDKGHIAVISLSRDGKLFSFALGDSIVLCEKFYFERLKAERPDNCAVLTRGYHIIVILLQLYDFLSFSKREKGIQNPFSSSEFC